MRKEKREALEAAGVQFGTVAEFLGLTPEEEAIVELRVAVSMAVRRARERHNLTQAQVARKIKSTQARIAKIESDASDVSLDLMFRGLFAAGGNLDDLTARRKAKPPAKVKRTVKVGK